MVSSTKDHSSSAAVINMHSAETTMRITVIHIIIYTVADPLALPWFYWFSVKDWQRTKSMSWFFMPTGCQVVSLPVGETAPWTSGYIRPNPDGLQPVLSFVWLSFEGVGWATLRLGGGLPWCQLCHLCAASPSHPLWKSEKMPNNGELRKSLKQIAFATIPNNAQIFAELSVCPINNNNCRCL